MNNPLVLEEHQSFEDAVNVSLKEKGISLRPPDFLKEPEYLGIYNNCASYYIGAAWLVQKEWAVVVHPKVQNVDFVQMFLSALAVDTQNESDYFSKCYGIKFDEPLIETDEQLNQLTPLLVLHYISLLDRLVKRGLKKGYVDREENLKSKLKGRIVISRHLNKNVFQQRNDRVFCKFQEYTADFPENRLLKKALLLSERLVDQYSSLKKQIEATDVPFRIANLKASFQNVSDNIEIWEVKNLSTNNLFKEHSRAVMVAKMLLRRFDYSISNASIERNTTPPFWIDMSRLYEMWVWKKLTDNSLNKVLFQENGFYGRQVADFVVRDEKLILDAKYKLNYANDSFVNINDIREISGNARDESLLPNIPDDYSPRCVIIYPGDNDELKNEAVEPFDKQGVKISHYRNFYKISIPLPKN